jgi:hypothetical protein
MIVPPYWDTLYVNLIKGCYLSAYNLFASYNLIIFIFAKFGHHMIEIIISYVGKK